jgi:SAM-dependent methyltransferase
MNETSAALRSILDDDLYIRDRLIPSVSNGIYLHLVDLLEAVKLFATIKRVHILDYGCGGSPYRCFFPNSDYKRADFTECASIDYLVPIDSTVPAPDKAFDMVLSTQVLEHVPDPDNYLSECFRLLTSGGDLVLTTHGLYEEHGCPYDFHRWTADGLRLHVEKAGFEITALKKLTCGPRAVCFFLNQRLNSLRAPKSSLFGFAMWMLRGFTRVSPGWLNRVGDRHFKAYGVMDASAPGSEFYVALLVQARRR